MNGTLVVVRHAHALAASAPHAEVGDAERSLSPRGAQDADGVGAWLADSGVTIDLLLVSAARRTRQTADAVQAAVAVDRTAVLDSLYLATGSGLQDEIRERGGSVGTVGLVGHAPGVGDLVQTLLSADTDPTVRWQLQGGMPTAGVVVLNVPGPWSELTAGTASLMALTGPSV